jgi:protein-disulfide isomerase
VTQAVKEPARVETPFGVDYNLPVIKVFVAVTCVLLASACEKKPAKGDTGAVSALDRAGGPQATGPVDETPLEGIDIAKLSAEKQKLLYKLVGSLTSPCGKAHSLRTSYATDTSCKRAPFAVRYVVALLEDEGNETQVREEYDAKYTQKPKPVQLDVSAAPRTGADDAPVRLVEFFDYQCPHCAQFKPMLDAVAASLAGKVVIHYMMFPLDKHTDAKSAAAAALAANRLGKFKEMHALLFQRSPRHSRQAVVGYAKEIGLDAAQFEAAYDAAMPQVQKDVAQGEAAGVEATPTLYFNDRKYEGPLHPKYIAMWVEEEVAVNR